uniref:Uncharacterized protein n=1 Tax=Parascaris equorum TaxID=6256 RepID=A0A914RD11_PAREQ
MDLLPRYGSHLLLVFFKSRIYILTQMTTTGEHEHRLTTADDSWEQRNGPLVLEERLTESSVEVEAGCSIVYNNPYITLSIQQQRARLPIFKQ